MCAPHGIATYYSAIAVESDFLFSLHEVLLFCLNMGVCRVRRAYWRSHDKNRKKRKTQFMQLGKRIIKIASSARPAFFGFKFAGICVNWREVVNLFCYWNRDEEIFYNRPKELILLTGLERRVLSCKFTSIHSIELGPEFHCCSMRRYRNNIVLQISLRTMYVPAEGLCHLHCCDKWHYYFDLVLVFSSACNSQANG